MKIFDKMTLPRILSVLSIFFLASCASVATPKIYMQGSGLTMELTHSAYGIRAVAVSNDGLHVLTADNGGISEVKALLARGIGNSTVRLWNISSGSQISAIKEDILIVRSVDFSPDGTHALISGGFGSLQTSKEKNRLKLWDLSSGELIWGKFKGKDLMGASFSPNGKYILARYWEQGPLGGSLLGSGSQNTNTAFILEASTGKIVKTLEHGAVFLGTPLMAVFSPDGKYVLSSSQPDEFRLWDVETGKEIRKFKGHDPKIGGMVTSLSFSPDGRYALSSVSYDAAVILWDIETGKEVKRFTGFDKIFMDFSVVSASFSPDGKSAFIVGLPLKLWDIASGKERTAIKFEFELKVTGHVSPGVFNPNGKSVLFATADGSVRVFDAATGQEVAMMVGFEDGEWLAITPEGYYNSSEKGAQYLSVLVGEKKYNMNLFYDVFYRPDIVAAKLRGEDIKDLVTITMQDAIKTPPPVVEINPISSTTNDPKVKVCYKAHSTGGGIGEIRLFHNGKLIESDGYYKEAAKTSEKMHLASITSNKIYEDIRSVKIKGIGEISPITSKTKGELFEDCKEVDAMSGENEVSITAFNSNNTVQSYMQTVKFNSTIKPEEPHLYILSIGIDQYKDAAVNLKYAVKDAVDIKEKMLKQAGTLYKPENIHHISLTDNEATKTNIISRINELSKKIRPADNFILFVAGHGILLQNQYYMLTNDFDGTISENNVLSSNEIVEISKKIKSLSQLFIFDTCHAGGVDYIVSGLYDARMSVLAKKMGLHIYASASDKQSALDGYKGNGLFTYTLLDGLNNNMEADKNKDNKISLIELGEYSKTTTTDISKKIGHAQTPLIINFGKDNAVYQLR